MPWVRADLAMCVDEDELDRTVPAPDVRNCWYRFAEVLLAEHSKFCTVCGSPVRPGTGPRCSACKGYWFKHRAERPARLWK